MKLSKSEQRILDKAARIMEKSAYYYPQQFTSAKATKQYFFNRLAGKDREEFHVLFLDNQHQLIACDILFVGTIDCASVYPRELVKQTLEHGASAIVLAHNHPSGTLEPSRADIEITKKIKNCMNAIEVRVLDHLIVGHGTPASFAEQGLI